MSKENCWEVKGCGREPGGAKAVELGICPAATDRPSHGVNDGQNGGRFCWAVSGTLCGGVKQGTFAQKRLSCMSCEFFGKVRDEQGLASFVMKKS